MQEVFIDHWASHTTLQMHIFSNLSLSAAVTTGSAPSWPGDLFWSPSAADSSLGYSVSQLYSRARDASLQRERGSIPIFLQPRILLPCLDFHLYHTCHNTDCLTWGPWALLWHAVWHAGVLVDARMKRVLRTTLQHIRSPNEKLLKHRYWKIK